jgi:eukaryotic-like serine/threonine-protein kinase
VARPKAQKSHEKYAPRRARVVARPVLIEGQMEGVASAGEEIRLLRLLGRGGMGTVWLGLRAGIVVAVKMMLPSLVAEPSAVARFERELRILGALRTRHAVRLLTSGRHAGHPYAVMENVLGTSLADRLEARGKPPCVVAFGIVRELLVALREVHAEGVVHRDVKPANIMLSGLEEGARVTLVDFGVASSRREPALAPDPHSMRVGTAPYMSPEQLTVGGAGSVHEDLWAGAVVAYECLVGRVPFGAPSYAAGTATAKRIALLPPSAVCPDLPQALDAWFARAFAPRLDDRFSDAGAMAAAWDVATSAGTPRHTHRARTGGTRRAAGM